MKDFTDPDDCPAWVFDATLAIPSHEARIPAPEARPGAAARPAAAERPSLFREETKP